MFNLLKLIRTQLLVVSLISLLLITNAITIVYYKSSIKTLKKQSSFVAITQNANAESFKECLKKSGIDYKIDGNEVKVREVEQNDAIAKCS